MAWETFGTHTSGTALTVADGDKISNNVKQLATDIYITPTNGDDGAADLAYPLEKLAPVYSGIADGNGSTGTTITLPVSYTPSAITEYLVLVSWQEDPGSNGALWVEKTTTNFVIKHSGSETGKKIGYSIVRATA